MSESSTPELTITDPYERIASAIRDALPGEAGDRLLAAIVTELAAVDDENGADAYGFLHLELERQVATDPLTGLPNRVRFMDDLTRAIAAATRYDEPLSLLVLDLVDPGTDEQAAGEGLLRLVRISDVVARIAPARFAIVLPRTGTVGCALVAARVTGNEGIFTCGSATFAGEPADAVALLARAEDALDGQLS